MELHVRHGGKVVVGLYHYGDADTTCLIAVNGVTVNIRAETVYGVRHGLETLSQLVARVSVTTGKGRSLSRRHTLIITSNVQVTDAPVFRHRGLMLDTARNFLPMNAIKRTLDAMASCKLNVLHWHATDTQSFPLESPRVPQLARWVSLRVLYFKNNYIG